MGTEKLKTKYKHLFSRSFAIKVRRKWRIVEMCRCKKPFKIRKHGIKEKADDTR